MSRMDRYKHVHEESEKEEQKETIFARRELKNKTKKQTPTSEAPDLDDPFSQTDQRRPYTEQKLMTKKIKEPKSKKRWFGKTNKPKKRKKHPVLRFLLKLLIFIIAYSGIAFFVGYQVAKQDHSIPQEDLETFNGLASQNGGHNILLLGSDSRDGEAARADSMMVLQLDGSSKKPKMISFMRDLLVDIPGYGLNKLNAAYAFGGAELVRQTLAQNFGVETQYYTMLDFKSFEKVIDTLFPSGVAINSEKDFELDGVNIQQGPQKMKGLPLLQYARFRMDEEGDFGRVRRQQQVMTAVFSQMKNPLTILKLPYAAGKVMGYASTNLPLTFLLKNTFTIAKGAGGVERLTIPVDGSWDFGETDVGSVLFVDNEMNTQAIQEFLGK